MIALLQPGDIIDYRRYEDDVDPSQATKDNGHAVLYVGGSDHYTLESSGVDYDYSTMTDPTEAIAIRHKIATSNGVLAVSGGNMFGAGLSRVAIIRPLNGLDLTPRASAQAYVTNQSVSVTKTASVKGTSVAPGGEITYTITINNESGHFVASARTFTVTDPLPANVTFVESASGGTVQSGNVVFENVSVAKNAIATLKYTVRVNNTASGVIEGTTGNANGLEFACHDVVIGKNLTALQKTVLGTALSASKPSGTTALAWVNNVYQTVIGKDLAAATDEEVYDALFKAGTVSTNTVLGYHTRYYFKPKTTTTNVEEAFVEGVYGGYYVQSQSQEQHYDRIRYLDPDSIKVGDLLVATYVNDKDTDATNDVYLYEYYICNTDGSLCKVTDSGKSTVAKADVVDRVLAYSRFALLRPSMLGTGYVAEVDDGTTTTQYKSIVDAVAYANTKDSSTNLVTVTLIGDEEFAERAAVAVDRYVSLKVTGNTTLSGPLTIDGGSKKHIDRPIEITKSGMLTLMDGVTVTGIVNNTTDSAGGYGAFRVAGHLVLDNATISNCSGIRGAVYAVAGSTVEVKDSTFAGNKSVIIDTTTAGGGGAV